VPKEKKRQGLYFPTTVERTRVIRTKADDATDEATQTVTKVTEKDGVYTVSVELKRCTGTDTQQYEVSPKGVALLTGPDSDSSTRMPMLRLDVKVGESWKTDVVKWTHTVGKEVEVEVTAGKYKALGWSRSGRFRWARS